MLCEALRSGFHLIQALTWIHLTGSKAHRPLGFTLNKMPPLTLQGN